MNAPLVYISRQLKKFSVLFFGNRKSPAFIESCYFFFFFCREVGRVKNKQFLLLEWTTQEKKKYL